MPGKMQKLRQDAWGFAGQLPDGGRSVPLCPEAGGKEARPVPGDLQGAGTAPDGLRRDPRGEPGLGNRSRAAAPALSGGRERPCDGAGGQRRYV